MTDVVDLVLSIACLQLRRMGNMVMSRRVAMVQVRATDFCNATMPFPQKVVDLVHHRLPLIANKRNDELLTIIKVCLHTVFVVVVVVCVCVCVCVCVLSCGAV